MAANKRHETRWVIFVKYHPPEGYTGPMEWGTEVHFLGTVTECRRVCTRLRKIKKIKRVSYLILKEATWLAELLEGEEAYESAREDATVGASAEGDHSAQ